MVEKRTNDTGKEQKLRRNNERNLLKIAQINQMGLRKPRKCSIIKKSKVLLANNRLTKGSNG